MTSGIIDSSTLFEVIHLLRERRPEDTSSWTWRCSVEVSNALVHGRQLGIAHTPKLATYPSFWGYVQRRLADQVVLATPTLVVQREARALAWNRSEERRVGKECR